LGSVYASDTIGLFNDRVLITGGLRLQTIETRGYAYSDGFATPELAGDETSRLKTDAASPVVGIVVKPVNGLSLFANRIEGLQQGATAPVGTVNSGQIFAPFKSTQYEIGGKLSVGRFNASLAAYQTKQPSAFSVPVGNGLFRYEVAGEQRNRGIELSVDGELVDGLRVIAGGSIIDAELANTPDGTNDGNKAQGVPDYLVNANVEWDLPFVRGATLTGRVVNTGKQHVNVANTLEIPSWTRVDLGARYVAVVADKPLTFRFTVDNIANKRYWASAFDSFGTTLLQGAPRTFKLSASIDL
jgi:iron complex outermembrane receptor protein